MRPNLSVDMHIFTEGFLNPIDSDVIRLELISLKGNKHTSSWLRVPEHGSVYLSTFWGHSIF